MSTFRPENNSELVTMARGRGGEKQSYERLRAHHRQLGVPWTDNSFPANDSSIGLQKVSPERRDPR